MSIVIRYLLVGEMVGQRGRVQKWSEVKDAWSEDLATLTGARAADDLADASGCLATLRPMSKALSHLVAFTNDIFKANPEPVVVVC